MNKYYMRNKHLNKRYKKLLYYMPRVFHYNIYMSGGAVLDIYYINGIFIIG